MYPNMNDTEQLLFAIGFMIAGLGCVMAMVMIVQLVREACGAVARWRQNKALEDDIGRWHGGDARVMDKATLDRVDANWRWAERERRERQKVTQGERLYTGGVRAGKTDQLKRSLRKGAQDEVKW